MSTWGPIYRVVRTHHYNASNDPFSHYTLKHDSHGVILVF
jgi:hypothetical protein